MKKLALILSLIMLFSAVSFTALAEAPQLSDDDLAQLEGLLGEEGDTGEYRVHIEQDDLSIVEGLNEDWMNILLMGADNDNPKQISGRTDAMLILSVNTVTGETKLSSIVRDLYVDLPVPGGRPWTDRINTACAYGGPYFAMKTVNQLFGLNISRYFIVNFKGFEKIVDDLGGVDIEISNNEAAQIYEWSQQRAQGGTVAHLNGAQALAYVRIRVLDNNFGRNERQRKFLISLFNKVVAENDINQIFKLAENMLTSMDTNVSAADMVTLIFNVLPNIKELQTYSCPQDGEYTFYTTKGGAAVVLAKDMEVVAGSLRAFIYGE